MTFMLHYYIILQEYQTKRLTRMSLLIVFWTSVLRVNAIKSVPT